MRESDPKCLCIYDQNPLYASSLQQAVRKYNGKFDKKSKRKNRGVLAIEYLRKAVMYKAVILDLDGTLIDTTEGVLHAVDRTINTLGLVMLAPSILQTFVGPPMQLSFEQHYNMDPVHALDAANLFRRIYKEESLFKAEIYSDVEETLKYLKMRGFKLAVATNKSHENAMQILQHFRISDYCDYIKGADLQGKLKKADIILDCCTAIGCIPEECICVGDSIFDLEGAVKCGMDFVAVTYGFGFKRGEMIRSQRVISIINSFRELQNVLRSGGAG